MRPLSVDLTGQRFGRLVVTERAPNQGAKVMWHCICDCGGEKDVQSFNLIFSRTTSCGCYRRERQREIRTRMFPEPSQSPLLKSKRNQDYKHRIA